MGITAERLFEKKQKEFYKKVAKAKKPKQTKKVRKVTKNVTTP